MGEILHDYWQINDAIILEAWHSVILIIGYGFVADLLELRMNFLQDFGCLENFIPASLIACTLANLFYYAQFLITYIEALVSIHYFTARFFGKAIPIVFIYAGIVTVFVAKIVLFVINLDYGKTSGAYMYCSAAYEVDAYERVSYSLWCATMVVSPALCLIWIIKAVVTKQHYTGVTAFLLLSSAAMAILVLSFFLREYTLDVNYADRGWYEPVSVVLYIIAYYTHEFRLFMLCLLATVLVREIRDNMLWRSLRFGCKVYRSCDCGNNDHTSSIFHSCSCNALHSDGSSSQDSRPFATIFITVSLESLENDDKIPGVGVYALTVASICTTRARLNATIFYDLPSDGSYEPWFFGYYEFINGVTIISYVHQFLIGLLYFAQNVNAFLMTLDRFFAIAGFLWKESTATSLSTQVAFGCALLIFCAILNVISFHRLRQTQISGKNVKIVERSMFAISICIFITQAVNILILIAIYYFILISPNWEACKLIYPIMPFLSDLFSLGPGVYTIIVPGPIRRQCISMLLPWRKSQAKGSSNIQMNIYCSVAGYCLFVIILLSARRTRVLKRFLHNVLLILNFALLTDLLEFRIVSIHLILSQICVQSLSVIFIYGLIGLLFFFKLSLAVWSVAICVAPLLSLCMLVRNCITWKHSTSNIFAFILSSSLVTGLFVIGFQLFRQALLDWYSNGQLYVPWYGKPARWLFRIAYDMHDIRFLLLCVLSVAVVKELRVAVFSTLLEIVRKIFRCPEPPSAVDNDLNIVCSLLGYFLFGIILYSTHKKGVLKRFVHNVILILNFAFITDIMEMRVNCLIVFDLQYKVRGGQRVPTTLWACTVTNMFFYLHFLITYIEAFWLLFVTLMYGNIDFAPVYCTRLYVLNDYMRMSAAIWALSILVAPLLSTVMLILNCIKKKNSSAVFSTIVEVVRKVLGRAEHPSTVDNNVFLESLGSYENKPDTGKARHAMLL
ncbi:hypothetical protein PRIPAC_83836 [Pristionchus pacificus]|uniref:Uncharacterized protein n=1 Tax=Pristionchus pacificus TaxID=54126 RepID=A0A2A6BSJ6_PRIPA|nr:hypothetical protein PRIPAC_83836 [Pristionchus pacificus]|eukprot:PDM68932.1 hypothetical protein PRIPAC_47234 [Pristionchus pacificus]